LTSLTGDLAAIARRDNVAQLLLSLGAEYNQLTRRSERYRDRPEHKKCTSYLDWIRFAIKTCKKKLREKKVETPASLPQEPTKTIPSTGWKKFYTKELEKNERTLKAVDEKNADTPSPFPDRSETKRRNYRATLEYMEEMERLLVARSAKTKWQLLTDAKHAPPAETSESPALIATTRVEEEKPRYYKLSGHQAGVGDHLTALYDELFEAVFTGNIDKVKQLCLPTEGVKPKDLLLVAVEASNGRGTRDGSSIFSFFVVTR
jgi:hypothetical protein